MLINNIVGYTMACNKRESTFWGYIDLYNKK